MKNSSGFTMKGAFYAVIFGVAWVLIVGYTMRQLGTFGVILALFGAVFIVLGANGLYQGHKGGEKLQFGKKSQPAVETTPVIQYEEVEIPQQCPYCGMKIDGVYTRCPRCGKRTNLREVKND